MTKRIESTNDSVVVNVYNNTQGTIGYTLPGGKVRVWPAPSLQKPIIFQKVKFEELVEAINVPAIFDMLDGNALLIKDAAVREELEISELDDYTMDSEVLLRFFEESTEEEFEDLLLYCSNAMFTKIIDLAIQNPIESVKKNRIIENYSGKDVLKMAKELEEEKRDEAPTTQRRIVQQPQAKPAEPKKEGALRSKIASES